MLKTLHQLFRTFTGGERLAFFVAFAVCGTSLVAGFWLTFYTQTVLEPARGGEYAEGIVGQPTAINPMLIGSSPADSDLVNLLFSDLVTLSQNIATSTTGKTWVVTLKNDMVWSDGKAITADDVIFTIHTIQNPEANSPLWAEWQGVTAQRISQREVRFTIKASYSYFIENLRNLRIAPAHVFESIPPSNIRLSAYNFEPVTSGPYSFISYEKERSGFIASYHLLANNAYPGPRALIEALTVRFFPSYTDALMSFNRRGIDGIGGFDPSSLTGFKVRHKIHEVALPEYYALFLNQSAQPALKDKNVRTALRLATDNDALITTLFDGHATAVWGPILPQLTEYSPAAYAGVHASPEEAVQILEKQQWRIGSDGVRTRTVGKTTQRLDFELSVPDVEFAADAANAIKSQWQKIGVRLTIKIIPAAEVQRDVIKPRNYQILLYGNVLRPTTDLFSFWHSSQRLPPGLNLAGYQNTAVDQAIETTRKTFDATTQITALAKAQQLIQNDLPAIFLFSPNYLYSSIDELGGFPQKMINSPHDRLTTITSWFLETNRVFK